MTAVAEPKVKAGYVMPAVEAGQMVLWYPDGDVHQEPIPAIVSAVNPRSVALNIIHQANHNFLLRDGVRHRGDPELKAAELRESGVWEQTARDRQLAELLRQMNLE